MLNVVKTTKDVYNKLPEEEKRKPATIFLCEGTNGNGCSIYSDGKCYGEDINEEDIDTRISVLEEELEGFVLADNYDIQAILDS